MAAVEIIYGYEEMTAGAHMFRPCGIFHHKTRGSIRIAARDQEHYEGVFDEICERARSVWDSEEPSQEDLLRLEDVLESPEEQPRG